jgi:hypothetical protein
VPFRWAFETLTPDPPQVVRTEPVDGETGVARDAALSVFFDRALKPGGQDVVFAVTGPAGEVKGHLSWLRGDEDTDATSSGGQAEVLGWNSASASGTGDGRYWGGHHGHRGLRFRPLQLLLPGVTYQVTVSGVENLYGVPMAAAHHWSFTVDATPGVFNEPTPVVKRYYFFAGQRVALRETGLDGQDVVYYLMGDHGCSSSRTHGHDERGTERRREPAQRGAALSLRGGALAERHVTNGLSLYWAAGGLQSAPLPAGAVL